MPIEIDRRHFIQGAAAACAIAAMPFPLMAQAPAADSRPDRELMVPVEGGRIYVRVNGRLAGPRAPVLMIHGGPGGNHASFLNALSLSDERAVILYDQLDSGRSDAPNDPRNWRVARFVDEIDAIRRALSLERLHVLGASWGGTIALEYGARRPPALAGLVLMSPLVSTRSWIADANALRARLPTETRAALDRCDPPAPATPACETATAAFYAAFNQREQLTPAMRAYRRALGGTEFNTQLYEAMWGRSEFVATGSLRNYDGELLLTRLPGHRTLFIVGQYDEARPATADAFALRTPGSSFAVVPGAAHSVFNDRPEETLGILRPWLRRQDRA